MSVRIYSCYAGVIFLQKSIHLIHDTNRKYDIIIILEKQGLDKSQWVFMNIKNSLKSKCLILTSLIWQFMENNDKPDNYDEMLKVSPEMRNETKVPVMTSYI